MNKEFGKRDFFKDVKYGTKKLFKKTLLKEKIQSTN